MSEIGTTRPWRPEISVTAYESIVLQNPIEAGGEA
jgi:hypothetical protein